MRPRFRGPWLILLAAAAATGPSAAADVASVYRTRETVTLAFRGPETSERATVNPFTDYRLTVRFTREDETTLVRGFYAADGNAANTGATAGNVWICRFTPPSTGNWSYEAALRRGAWIAIDDEPLAGSEVELDANRGNFRVVDWPATPPGPMAARDFRRLGRLTAKDHFFRVGDEVWLKAGANSPENLLAYDDFDNTRRLPAQSREGEAKTDDRVHAFAPHADDWKDGDPTWGEDRGKNLVGALNYLAGTGMNSVYFLTFNIGGDGRDVWPHLTPDDFSRFDCSKLAQWEIVFGHANAIGLALHVITQETENELLLDGGELGRTRQLYYRELIARFGHHPALVWNIGEESGPANFSPNGLTPEQQMAIADFFALHDPHDHPLLIHSHASKVAQRHVLKPLLGHRTIDGVSLQVSQPTRVHDDVLRWRRESAAAGHPWIVSMDEVGPASDGAAPDADDPGHIAVRGPVLWGSLMAGAAGVEWYFGYRFAHTDLGLEDWRSRSELWRQTDIARTFFGDHLSAGRMLPADGLVAGGDAHAMAGPDATEHPTAIAIYRHADQADAELRVDLSGRSGNFGVRWFDPVAGGGLRTGSVMAVDAGGSVSIGFPPERPAADWVALIRRRPDESR